MKLDLIHEKMDAVDKKVASLKAEQKADSSTASAQHAETKSPTPVQPFETEAPAHIAPAPALHEKPHG